MRPGLAVGSVASYRIHLNGFFGYCRKRGWMAGDPLEAIDRPTQDAKDPAILTPDEVARFMAEVARLKDGRIVKAVALRLFAGLRPGEQEALRERDILADGIRVGVGKIRGRRAVRVVPMSPVLRAWFAVFPDAKLQPANFRKIQDEAIRRAGLVDVWEKDILRHTWISYRLAETNDERLTAREAGNSPDIIYRHYYQLVTAAEVKQFGMFTKPQLMERRGT